LINQTLKTISVSKDRLFFDRFEYCLNFRLEELSVLRELDHAHIDRELEYRTTWRQRHPNFGGSWQGQRATITDQNKDHCHKLCDYLLSKQDYKLVIYNDWGYLYSNDLVMIKEMQNLSYLSLLTLKRVIVDLPRDSILIKSSQHEWRSYFSAGRMTEQQRDTMAMFLTNQSDIRIGPALKRLLTSPQKHCYINDSMFIDHNGQGITVMLGLILPRAIRKTLKLVRDK
jgi:hypothetical protein